jgi:stage II sporulation protein D
MRRLTTLILTGLTAILVASFASAAPAPPPAAAPSPSSDQPDAPEPVFIVTGGGWGHGVGLSQWGAYGQAAAGRGYDQILATYFQGTELGRSGRTSVRVLMAEGVEAATFTADGPVIVSDAAGRKLRVRDGDVSIPVTFEAEIGTKQELFTLTPPVIVKPTLGVHIAFGGVPRRGTYVVSVAAGGLVVVNELSMESYLRGVVPGEVPLGWPIEALKAQAVAARTYAISSLVDDKPYDVYADVRSQVYGGLPVESPSTDAAVLATSGQIVTYEGRPARTFYFSSSGGRTASALDVFGTDVPYLRSVADPWDVASPHHAWETKTFTADTLGRALGASAPVTEVVAATTDDGGPKLASVSVVPPRRLRVTATDGSSLELTLTDVRSRLGLASTNFRIGELGILPPLASSARGAVVTLEGVAREVDAPVLEKRRPDGTWQVARRLAPLADGTWSVAVQPVKTTTFRLSGSATSGPTVTVVVPSA